MVEVTQVVVDAIRRPQCSCCGYEAPLPTLRQFDGLCLGCAEEAEWNAEDAAWAEYCASNPDAAEKYGI